jgi:endonuclease/exonuclease/phosphatase (EEP) superfamily protein YafD
MLPPKGATLSTAHRVASIVVGAGLLIVAAGALLARYVPIPGHRTLYVVIASPYLILGGPMAIVVLAWGRQWVMAATAAILSVVLVVPQVPWYVAANPTPGGVLLRTMTLNLLFGHADLGSVTRVADEQADVVMVQELTPEAVQGLAAAGFEKTFPYRALDARGGAAGVGVYSRYPITDVDKIGGYTLAMVSARIQIDGVSGDISAVAVHFDAPWPQPIDGWRRDVARFPDTLKDLAAKSAGAPIVIGGDFNSTIDMQPFRDFLTNGYRDAADQAGAGRELTYPANRRIPPFMGIDHILTRDCTAVSSRTVQVPQTDHRAVLATVMLPRGRPAA